MSDTDFFVAQPGDWAIDKLDQLFQSGTILVEVIGVYNMIFAAIGGVGLMWLMTRIFVETGHHGSFGGRNSELWVPIRFVMAIGLLTPLPPSGMNSAQHAILGVSEMGLAAGSRLWTTAVSSTASIKPLTVPVRPSVRDMVGQLFMIEFCTAVQNKTAEVTNGARITESRDMTADFVRYNRDGTQESGGVKNQCGAVTFARQSTDNTINILDYHITATRALQDRLAFYARELAPKLLPPYESGKVTSLSFSPNQLMREYEQNLMSVAAASVTEANSRFDAYKAAATQGGWVKAGSWGVTLMQTNETLNQAVNALPEVSGPRYDWWSPDVYRHYRAAFQSAAQLWSEAVSREPSTNWDAYNAVADTGSGWQITSILDVSRYLTIYDHFLMEDGENPLTELTSLGHGIINTAHGVFLGYLTMSSTAAAADDASHNTAVGWVLNKVAGLGAVATGLNKMLEVASPYVFLMVVGLYFTGWMLAYALPLTPAIIWMFAVARHLMRVGMSVVGSNVWALAHMELEGEGLGQRSAQGYIIALDLLVRPMLLLIGLVFGYALIFILGDLFSFLYFEAVRNMITNHHFGVTGLIMSTFIGAGLMWLLCIVAFNFVTEGPDYIMAMASWHLRGTSGDDERTLNRGTQTAAGKAEAIMQRGGAEKGMPSPAEPAGSGGGGISNAKDISDNLPGNIGVKSQKM